uniref:Uncharacterized protein n=1 Tax=Opuntia streptacantha TaxID=393608 RepID=A0A7C8YTK9_OPUST
MSTNSTGDYRFIVYCFSACQGPFVRSSSGYYLMSTVRAVILLHTKMAQRLLSDSYGKCFEYTSSAPTTSEVWVCYSLSFWVLPFPDVTCISPWRCACLCFGWRVLFKASLSCFVVLVRRSSLRCGVPCVFLVSLGLAILVIYTSFSYSFRAYFFWWIVLVSVLSLMAPFSPPSPQNLAHNDDLASQNQNPHTLLNLKGVETPWPRKPSSSTPASFSEALILGVGVQCSAPTTAGVHELPNVRLSEPPPPPFSVG